MTFEALILLSTEEARGSADSVNQAWWAYNRLCRQDSVTDHGLKAKEEQLFEQLNKFMRQVQHDLGMNAKPAKSKRTSSA